MASATFGDGGRQGARRGALEQSGGSKCKKQKKTFTQKVEMQEGGGKSCRSGGGKRGGQVKVRRRHERPRAACARRRASRAGNRQVRADEREGGRQPRPRGR